MTTNICLKNLRYVLIETRVFDRILFASVRRL